MKKILLTATVQCHICQFHKPLAQMLHQKGWEVHVAARNDLSEKNGLQLDFADKVFDVPFVRSPFHPGNRKAYRQLKDIIATENYDVIHCNTPVGGVLTRLAAKKQRENGAKIIYTAHGFHFYKGAPKINWILYYPVEKFLCRYTDALITICNEDYKLAQKKLHTKIYHIHGMGVDPQRFCALQEDERQNAKQAMGYRGPVCLCVGELNANKNQATVIRAFAEGAGQYPDARLLLAGNGPNEAALRELTDKLGLHNNVDFLGFTTQPERYMQLADIAVSASYREGLPLNIMEAMLCEKAVVASDNRGHRELVEEGETGFLVAPDDSKAFSDRLLQLFGDATLRENLGRQGYQKAQDYVVSEVVNQLAQIYSKVLAEDS